MCFSPQRRAIFDISTSKSGPELTCFVHFHLHSGEQFFDISTSKSGPKLTCFVHFHCLAPQPRAIFQHLNFKKCSETVSFLTFLLGNVLRATAACYFSTSQLQKVVRTWHVLYIFTWKCPSRHSGVQFFNISTSKSGPELTCFGHFHLKMCFSPQRRAIFQHLNFKKWSGADMFWTFSLENVLLATAACNFSFLLWPHDSAPAALTSLLFDSPDTRIIEKTQHFATSLTFGADVSSYFRAIASSFFWLYFISSAFHLLFNSPYCRKFTI